MIAFATTEELKTWGNESRSRELLKEASEVTGKTVFLSHSSGDDELVAGAILVLENHGGRVYVDKKDPTLPKDNFTEVARHLRSVIGICRKMVLLVSKNSKDSKWIPWELGLGDGKRGDKNVAIFPSAEFWSEQNWAEQEYLGLYMRIVWGDLQGESEKQWMVIDHRSLRAEKLGQWLRS